MIKENKNQDLTFQYLFCQTCQGLGRTDNARCATCDGWGLGLWFSPGAKNQNSFLYWGRAIDDLHIYETKLEKYIRGFMNGLAFLVGFAGIILLAWFFYDFYGAGLFKNFDWLNLTSWSALLKRLHGDWRILLFWVSTIFDLYVYYRLMRETEDKTTVLKKIYIEAGEGNLGQIIEAADWSKIRTLSRRQVMDMSSAFTTEAIEAIDGAWQLAKKFNHREVELVHLLASIITSPRGNFIFSRLGVDYQALQQKLISGLSRLNKDEKGAAPVVSLRVKKAIFDAYKSAYEARQDDVGVSSLLDALSMQENDLAYAILYDLNIDRNKIKNIVAWSRINVYLKKRSERFRARARFKPRGAMNRAMTSVATPLLDRVSIDLTLQAAYSQLEMCVGRDDEIDQIFRFIDGGGRGILLVGQPGTGKTAVMEGIAQLMVEEEVPEELKDKRLVNVSVSQLIAGGTPSQVEERLLTLIAEVAHAGNIVLVFENITSMMGITAGGEQSLDVADVLGNYLSQGNLITIATANKADYTQYIENKSLIGQVMQKIEINEPEPNEAIQILESKISYIEYKNQVYFSYDALEQAVKLSGRYLYDQFLPFKAIMVLKETAVYVRQKKGKGNIVTGQDVAALVSEKTKIPLTNITEDESEKLLNLEAKIHERMIDQEEAVREVAEALRRARANLRDQKRPIANFLFLGPTGVGKTELAKSIAEVYFGSEENMIRLDMSEYQEKSALYRMIGSPVGQGAEAGYLTEAVRKNPFNLILCDEIEKAHPDILNIFLQIMDDGRLTDNTGRTVDFTNAILIMTSNAGSQYIQDQVRAGTEIETIKTDLINNYLKQSFRPEFLNRFDGIHVFKPLSMADVNAIAKLMLKKTAKNLDAQGIGFEATDAAVAELATAGFDPQFGARPLRRVIQERVDGALANLLIAKKLHRRDRVILDRGGEVKVVEAEKI